jgi:hypothetical protein
LKATTPARSLAAALLAIAATQLIGCKGIPATLGTDRKTARANADAMFGGLAARFDNVQRAPKFAQARGKLGRYALSPSGVYGDTSVWTEAGRDSTRTLTLAGTHTATGYLFSANATTPLPDAVGDARHVIRLQRVGDSQYTWDTHVDHAIGPVRPNEFAAAITSLIAFAQTPEVGAIRTANQTLFPRASRALGELFSLDTVRVTALGDGSSSVLVRFRIEPDRIAKTRPNFSRYLDKYVSPARYRLRLIDGKGTTWLDANGSDRVFTIAYRARGGELLALSGPPRSLPDSLQIAVDFSAKFMIFRVGVSNLVGDFSFVRSDGERGWMMRFRHEPDWHFPLAVGTLIRTSLRHPFSGDGITLRLSVRERAGLSSLLSRQAGVPVQESAIVRWIGGLGNAAMSDFAGRAEAEENRYVFEVLSALRDDFVSQLSPGE